MTDLVERYPNKLRVSFEGGKPIKAIIEGVEFVPATRIETLEARLLEAEMRAHKWMEAHDKLAAGKPYDYPKPADLPDALAEITRLQRELGNQPRVRMCEPKDE